MGNPQVTQPGPHPYPHPHTRNPHGFTRRNEPKNSQNGWEMTEIWAKQCSLTVLLLSQSFLNRFGCFWARFKRGGLENLYPYPYLCLPACLTRAGPITRDNLQILILAKNECRLEVSLWVNTVSQRHTLLLLVHPHSLSVSGSLLCLCLFFLYIARRSFPVFLCFIFLSRYILVNWSIFSGFRTQWTIELCTILT